MDKEIAKIKIFLDENTKFASKIAGTGTLYVNAFDLKVRISDHEEANTRLRESADKCFYLRTVDNQRFTAGDIIFDFLHWLEYEADFDFSQELKSKLYEI